MRRTKHIWRRFYGWHAVPKTERLDMLDADGNPTYRVLPGFNKVWSHQPGALLSSALKGTKQEGNCYVVWSDHSLRAITRRAYDLLAKVPPLARVPMLQKEQPQKAV